MTSSSGAQTSSLDQGLGGSFSSGLAQAEAEFAGVAKAMTATTEIDAYESLAALASAYQDMRVEFASPSGASFFFTGAASASFSGMGLTTVSTPTTTTTVVTDVPSSRDARQGTSPTRPLRIAATATAGRRSSSRPSAVIEGYAGAQAESDNSYTYTFEALGDVRQTLTIAYATSALIDGPVTYELSLINARTGARVGPTRWIDAISDGEDSWSLRRPGVYSLIVSEFSHVSATQNFGDMQSQGAFEMSIFAGGRPGGMSQSSAFADGGPSRAFQMGGFADSWSPDASAMSAPAAIPELPAWMLLLTGLAGVQFARTLRPLAAVPVPLWSRRKRSC